MQKTKLLLGSFPFLIMLLTGCNTTPEVSQIPAFEDLPVHTLENTMDVGCLGSFPESRIVRSPVLAAPKGGFRAYAEVEILSRLPQDPSAIPPCEHASRLFMRGPETADFRPVYSLLPQMTIDGNSLWLVDWSANGQQLLFGTAEWEYEADYYARGYWLYDTLQQAPRSVQIEAVLNSRFGTECVMEAGLAGFTEEGKLVAVAVPVVAEDFLQMEEDDEPLPSCVPRDTYFAFDPATNQLTPLPEDFSLQAFGGWND